MYLECLNEAVNTISFNGVLIVQIACIPLSSPLPLTTPLESYHTDYHT